jgi:aminopeptidase
MQDFQKLLARYAELIVVHGANVQPGQHVEVALEFHHRDLGLLIAEKAYARGAKFVDVDFYEPRVARTRFLHSKREDLSYVPPYLTPKYEQLVDSHGAKIQILGPSEPRLLADIEPDLIQLQQIARRKALKYFYDEGVGKAQVHWTVAAAATRAWAEQLFPELSATEAEDKLWQAIFHACRVDHENCLELWEAHDKRLHARAEMLTKLGIRTLHFKGPGTDLTVGLSALAMFKGGTDYSARNVRFEPNIPTEECFTTPDYRLTEGSMRVTRPIYMQGVLVENLTLEFKHGDLTSFKATHGEKTFAHYIATDPGAKRLGEVALVGIDSPVYQLGIMFQEIIFDENAACHIAIGQAYRDCLKGGTAMSVEQLAEIGCNESLTHLDLMISDDAVDVWGVGARGEEIPLLRKGAWVA